jgi:8-oxo-dGTP diphosphatase
LFSRATGGPLRAYAGGVSWLACAEGGSRHWGRHGAAGLLLVALDGERRRVLLDRRAHWVHQGGTVGIPGGAIHAGETVLVAAMREVAEEATGLDGLDPVVLGSHSQACDICARWTYTTVIASVPTAVPVRPRSFESDGFDWVEIEGVERLPLHPGLRRAWPSLRPYLSG